MTGAEVQQLKAYLALTAAYYGKQLDDAVIAMYAEDLADLPLAEVKRAIVLLRRDESIRHCPLPAQIRARLAPAETAEDQARIAEASVHLAISRFGWNNPELAKEHMGELAWEGVKRSGGWREVCEQADGGISRAQMRNLLEAIYRSAQAGRLEERPALPEGPGRLLESLQPVFKALPGGGAS